ncbi:DUF4286 family protein [Leptolyngbya sp. 7M]|uniref:DUF4286 family protein n=1 Tax=Leptolyngbya sp. 7M TaxID=2812896 RepID=UPI001B8BFB48|nr:DUF4286 family protein [Leptolyngbya sp. 7M]QYO65553.1 DUF4286 family protein [Leptolyngbya sp. 7M]
MMDSNQILYEVTVTVSVEIDGAFRKYMVEKHIKEVIDTGYFLSATFARIVNGKYRTSYVAADQVALNKYFAEHADRLRADFNEHFPNGVSIYREEWLVLHHIAS